MYYFTNLGKFFISEEALFGPLHCLKIALSAGTACPHHSGVATPEGDRQPSHQRRKRHKSYTKAT